MGSLRSQRCRWPKACSLTFCFRSSVVLPHDMSSLTLRMYLRARTVAAADESIHERLEVVQNHASNLLIWIHGSFACNALCLSAGYQYLHAAVYTSAVHLAVQMLHGTNQDSWVQIFSWTPASTEMLQGASNCKRSLLTTAVL